MNAQFVQLWVCSVHFEYFTVCEWTKIINKNKRLWFDWGRGGGEKENRTRRQRCRLKHRPFIHERVHLYLRSTGTCWPTGWLMLVEMVTIRISSFFSYPSPQKKKKKKKRMIIIIRKQTHKQVPVLQCPKRTYWLFNRFENNSRSWTNVAWPPFFWDFECDQNWPLFSAHDFECDQNWPLGFRPGGPHLSVVDVISRCVWKRTDR